MTVQVTPRDAVSNIKKSKTTISGSPKGKILSRAFSEKLHSPLIYPSASQGYQTMWRPLKTLFYRPYRFALLCLTEMGRIFWRLYSLHLWKITHFSMSPGSLSTMDPLTPAKRYAKGFGIGFKSNFILGVEIIVFRYPITTGRMPPKPPGRIIYCSSITTLSGNEDFLPGMVSVLNDAAVGAVGLKLMDAFSWDGALKEGAIQHLGVHFNVDQSKKILRPYEMRSVATFERLDNSIRRVACGNRRLYALPQE